MKAKAKVLFREDFAGTPKGLMRWLYKPLANALIHRGICSEVKEEKEIPVTKEEKQVNVRSTKAVKHGKSNR